MLPNRARYGRAVQFGWIATAGLIVAGCSSIVTGAGQPLPVPTTAAAHVSSTGPSPAHTPSHTRSVSTRSASATRAAVTTVTPTSTCAPVFFGVAGSGQGPQHPLSGARPAGVSGTDAHSYGTAVALLKTNLVKLANYQLTTRPISYPAVSLPKWFGPDGQPTGLDASEATGALALATKIRSAEQGSCLGRTVLLAGYSQGAEVVIRAVNALNTAQRAHISVVLFGNPSYRPGITGDYPGTVSASGVRWSLSKTGFSLPDGVRARTLDICAPGDPVCGMSPAAKTQAAVLDYLTKNADTHALAYAFGDANYANLGAQFLWRHR